MKKGVKVQMFQLRTACNLLKPRRENQGKKEEAGGNHCKSLVRKIGVKVQVQDRRKQAAVREREVCSALEAHEFISFHLSLFNSSGL